MREEEKRVAGAETEDEREEEDLLASIIAEEDGKDGKGGAWKRTTSIFQAGLRGLGQGDIYLWIIVILILVALGLIVSLFKGKRAKKPVLTQESIVPENPVSEEAGS